MKGYKAKTRNRNPCRGVIGGVTETPPDTQKERKRGIGKLVGGARNKLHRTSRGATATNFLFPLPRQTAVATCYDNNNVTTPSLLRVFIACFVVMILLMLFN